MSEWIGGDEIVRARCGHSNAIAKETSIATYVRGLSDAHSLTRSNELDVGNR